MKNHTNIKYNKRQFETHRDHLRGRPHPLETPSAIKSISHPQIFRLVTTLKERSTHFREWSKVSSIPLSLESRGDPNALFLRGFPLSLFLVSRRGRLLEREYIASLAVGQATSVHWPVLYRKTITIVRSRGPAYNGFCYNGTFVSRIRPTNAANEGRRRGTWIFRLP